MKRYRLVEINEAACPARKYANATSYASEADAVEAAVARMGNPARKRKFYALAVEGPDGTREIIRGTA